MSYELDTVDHITRQAFMKMGANQSDVARIKAGYEAGKTAQQISEEVLVVLSCVETFAPDYVAPVKAPAEDAASDDSDLPQGAEAFEKVARTKSRGRSK